MQDRYAGDVGDFLKLGLLRWLVAAGGFDDPLTLGAVWYRVADEDHNADGKHVAYLRASPGSGRSLRGLDADLFDRLGSVVATGDRSVTALVTAGALPVGSVSFDTELSLRHLPIGAKRERLSHRESWVASALDAVRTCEVIFADPDNGIRRADHNVGAHRDKAVKHAYLDELSRFSERGQSLVVYHHADRSAPVQVQATRRMDDIADALGSEPLAAVRASRGTTRLFLVAPAAAQRQRIELRLRELEQSPWSNELTVYWRS